MAIAFFHSAGNVHSCSDLLKSKQSGFAIEEHERLITKWLIKSSPTALLVNTILMISFISGSLIETSSQQLNAKTLESGTTPEDVSSVDIETK